MKSKKIMLPAFLAVVMLVGACSTFTISTPTANYSAFPADGGKYSILGRVTVTVDQAGTKVNKKNPSAGGAYQLLLAAAQKKHPGTDDVVNILIDSNATYQKSLFGGTSMTGSTYVITGIAIRYK